MDCPNCGRLRQMLREAAERLDEYAADKWSQHDRTDLMSREIRKYLKETK